MTRIPYQDKSLVVRGTRPAERLRLCSCLFACLSLMACGYQMSGSGNLPAGLQHIAVHVLENRTSETGLETIFTNALVDAFNSRMPGTLVGPDRAPAFLKGRIESLGWETIARSGPVTALERRVFAVMSVDLVDKQGQVMWRSGPLRGNETYAVESGDLASDLNKNKAIIRLAERLAEDTLQRMTADF
jgi:hypothetical protein